MSPINILERWFWQTEQPFGKAARSTADALGTAAETAPTLRTISFFLNKTTFKPSMVFFLKDNSNLKQALLPVTPLKKTALSPAL